MKFDIYSNDNNARIGKISTAHSEFNTPCFMPVGTQGCIKALDANDMHTLGAKIILANTYHTYLRPGANLIARHGGLHNYTKFNGSFLTDSGGFQAFSLSKNTKRNDDGIVFKSHIDGSVHNFTPFSVLKTQYLLNSDICMVLDDLCALPASNERIKASLKRTISWAKSSLLMKKEFANYSENELLEKYSLELYGTNFHKLYEKELKREQNIFAIVQGGTNNELRSECLKGILDAENDYKFDGLAIGGLSVGEPNELMYETVENLTPLMPQERPRYLMGVGTPLDLIENVARGVDMFDCVMPTRNARNGTLFTSFGKINIKSSAMKDDKNPIDSNCSCYACKNYSRSYIHHLFKAGEITFFRLASLHNLHYYLNLMSEIRENIANKTFANFYKNFKAIYK